MKTSRDPVFVHSSFRVSSTWFWNHLRALDGVTAYYEFLHERLASVDREGVDRFNTECWDSGHPRTAPYFSEYLPLISAGGGVQHYSEQMAWHDFVPDGGIFADLDSGTRTYVGGLIGSAAARDTRAVLTCGRSLGRIAGLKRAFGGQHVLLVRDLSRQWSSYLRLGNAGTWYFHNATLSVLANGRFNDAHLAHLFDEHTQREACRGDVTLLRFISLDHYFRSFVAAHLYFYLAAFDQVDLVLDVSAMAASGAELAASTEAFAALTGLSPDFRDIRGEAPDPPGALRITGEEATAMLVAACTAIGVDRDSEAGRWGARLLEPVTG